jgi:hypothetical protein
LAWRSLAKEGLDLADPEGNLWGLTKPADEIIKRYFGFNPSNLGEQVPLGEGDMIRRLREANRRFDEPRGLPESLTGTSVPSVGDRTREQAGEMGDAGRTLGGALMRGIEEEMRNRIPSIVQELARQLSSITVSPRITPRIDGSDLRGVHGDVGVDVAR